MPPAVEPIRERIIEAVRARLATLAAGGTYWYTPGEVGRDWKLAEECQDLAQDRPYYGVVGGLEEPKDADNRDVHELLTVLIVGWIADSENRDRAVNRALADLIVATYTDETWGLGPAVLYTEVGRREPEHAALLARPFGYFELELKVHYDRARTAA